ncbi:hypothetical protein D1BOALGB6SA_3029 [Olavius sp. associated proteobacterium Delta 1]|nr:hypothetical protein D1BOALGB6SA_3029 [Olavius sp. associated proteobacterium Delta 1]
MEFCRLKTTVQRESQFHFSDFRIPTSEFIYLSSGIRLKVLMCN